MKVVFNSSPLIFLSRLGYLELFLQYDYEFCVPEVVIEEIFAKPDEASKRIGASVANNGLTVKQVRLISLAKSINERLGRGEAAAIALATELQSDFVILDDFAARREALRLGLNVKGTLAIIKKMITDGKIEIEDLEQFYQQILQIKFRIKRSVFEAIFTD